MSERSESKARAKLDEACKVIARIYDAGQRDPLWSETEAFENAGLELGRLLNKRPK